MRLIDADALVKEICRDQCERKFEDCDGMCEMVAYVENAPTIGGWISVKDRLPEEHDSLFAKFEHLSKHMWAKESDNVIVYVRFPDGTGRATEGRLQDGKWWTRISPTIEPVVTYWRPFPEPPESQAQEPEKPAAISATDWEGVNCE